MMTALDSGVIASDISIGPDDSLKVRHETPTSNMHELVKHTKSIL